MIDFDVNILINRDHSQDGCPICLSIRENGYVCGYCGHVFYHGHHKKPKPSLQKYDAGRDQEGQYQGKYMVWPSLEWN